MRKCFTTCVAMFAIAMIAQPAQGLEYIWTNDAVGDTSWHTPGNWDRDDGTVPDSDDKAIIAVASGYPTSSINVTIDALTVNSGAELTVTGFDLTIEEPNGLTVANTGGNPGELIITAGKKVKLEQGGKINLDGTITFTGANGRLQLSENSAGSSVYVIPASTTGEIVGVGTGIIDDVLVANKNTPVLVVGAGVELLGQLSIGSSMINNGLVHADRAGSLALGCGSKAGNGVWKVSGDAAARLVSKGVVAGGPDSIIEIEGGTFKVDAGWVSCGSVWMLKTAGTIDVGAEDTLRIGTDTGECVCGG